MFAAGEGAVVGPGAVAEVEEGEVWDSVGRRGVSNCSEEKRMGKEERVGVGKERTKVGYQ